MAKFFALALLSVYFTVFAAVSADEDEKCVFKEMLKESIDACKDKISEENQNALKEDESTTNPEIQAFQACIFNHAGFLKDGKFDFEKINSSIDKGITDAAKAQIIKSMVETCAKPAEGAGNDSEVVAKYMKCVFDAKKAAKAEKQ